MSDKIKVDVDCDRRRRSARSEEYEGGWYYYKLHDDHDKRDWDDKIAWKCAKRYETYDACLSGLAAEGYVHSNAGWRKKMLSWNHGNHSLQGYPGWETKTGDYGYPTPVGFVKLTHRHKKGDDESANLAREWDDLAETHFYSRDHSTDGSVCVTDGDVYYSTWVFATAAEADRFRAWLDKRGRR